MAKLVSITLKGVGNVLKKLSQEQENQMQAMEKAQTKLCSQAVKQLRRGLGHFGGRTGKIEYSPKGDMPFKHTGQLQDSIGFKVLRVGKKVKSEVGSVMSRHNFEVASREAPYAKYLEGNNHDGIRPFLWAIRALYTPERAIAYFNEYYKPLQGDK